MSRSYDLFSEGLRKRHPRALGLDELIGRFWGLMSAFGLPFNFVIWCPFCDPLGLLTACLL
jgi:hypothetical protein